MWEDYSGVGSERFGAFPLVSCGAVVGGFVPPVPSSTWVQGERTQYGVR